MADSEGSREQFLHLCEEMIAAWQSIPAPAAVPVGDGTRAALSEIGAVEIIWGWTARVIRLGEAALILDRHGFDTEVSPTIRSMVEHVIALPWVIDQRGRAYQALGRQRAYSMEVFKKAQTPGWTLTGEAAELIERAINIETDEDTKSEDINLATLHRAQRYDLLTAYQSWLVETWATHASFDSATVYSELDTAAMKGKLSRTARPSGRAVPAAVAMGQQAALSLYAQFDPRALGSRPAAWLEGMEAAKEQFMQEQRSAVH